MHRMIKINGISFFVELDNGIYTVNAEKHKVNIEMIGTINSIEYQAKKHFSDATIDLLKKALKKANE